MSRQEDALVNAARAGDEAKQMIELLSELFHSETGKDVVASEEESAVA